MINLKLLAHQFMTRGALTVYQALSLRRVPNISGDRDIEWSWVSARMPDGPGKALDFGPGGSNLGLVAAQRGFDVTAIDLEPFNRLYTHPNIHFIQGDILIETLPENHYDLIINCSTVEHVGLAGRYGVNESQHDGDLMAMIKLRELMKPDGIMLLTIPAGEDKVYYPWHRIYGKERLPQLIKGLNVEQEAYWVKDSLNKWQMTDKDQALGLKTSAGSWNALRNYYALACFVLRNTEK